ncbi:MAG: hypothetical protein ACRDOJ_04290 [Nocardioidaceae bacterium]
MNAKMIALYAGMSARMRHALEARGEKGQGTLEYVGIVVVAALLVAAVVGAVEGADIEGFISGKISEITSG